MVLMSSLLYCTLLLLLPQALGDNRLHKMAQGNTNTSYITKGNHMVKKRLLNVQDPQIVYAASDLQEVFTDNSCIGCIPCMERAIAAHKVHKQVIYKTVNDQEIMSDGTNHRQRDKRDVAKGKAKMPKRKSTPKYYTVTKFNRDGEVYALKVKEVKSGSEKENNATIPTGQDSSCHIYRVKKTYLCESEEGRIILNYSKRRAVKGVAKESSTVMNPARTTTYTPQRSARVFNKRQTDSVGADDNYMPSVELY